LPEESPGRTVLSFYKIILLEGKVAQISGKPLTERCIKTIITKQGEYLCPIPV
jgi:hypothetical protein